MAYEDPTFRISPTFTGDTIRALLALAPSSFRPPILGNPDGSKRQWLFDDAAGKYVELPYFPVETLEVTSIDSFRTLVLDRKMLPGPDDNTPLVIFNKTGGRFYPSKGSLDGYDYRRRINPVWTALTGALQSTFQHAEFLRFIHSISSSVADYAAFIRPFKRVVFNKNATLSSAPMMEDDGAHLSYSLEMTARDGKSQAHLPATLELNLPYVDRGPSYLVPLELDIMLGQDNGLRFRIYAPTLAEIELQALHDEVLLFDVAESGILILENF